MFRNDGSDLIAGLWKIAVGAYEDLEVVSIHNRIRRFAPFIKSQKLQKPFINDGLPPNHPQ